MGVDVVLVVFRIDVFVDVSTVILFCHGVVSRRWSVMGVHDFVCLFVLRRSGDEIMSYCLLSILVVLTPV